MIINHGTRKLMTIHKALHPRDEVDGLYVSKREGGGGRLNRIEDSVDASIQHLEDYIQKRGERLITAIRNNTNNMKTKRTIITRKEKWEEKQIYGRFKWPISKISHLKMWMRLRKGNLKRETESLLIVARNNAIWINHIKVRIDKTQQNIKCRLCGDREETITHMISEWSKLAQKEYKSWFDWVSKVIH